MKIFYINSDCGFGSTGRIVLDLYKEVIIHGDQAVVAYGRDCVNSSKIKCIKIGNRLDVYKHVIQTRLFDRQGFSSKYPTLKLIKQIERFQPDIVHLHNIHGNYINIKILFEYLKKADLKVVWTLHDCWPFTGHCAYYTHANCKKWKLQCNKCPQKLQYPASYFKDSCKKNYNEKKQIFNDVKILKIITVSEWLKTQVEQSFLKGYPIQTITNGVDITVFKPLCSEFKKENGIRGKMLLGVSSIWTERKGIDFLNKLSYRLPFNCQMVLVGITKKQKQKINNKIICIDRTNNLKELVEIYSAADIFLNTSYEETFGLVTLEALACGTQVITNNYTANPELIDQKSGIVVTEMTIEKYLQGIRELLTNPKKESDCINRAKQYENGNKLKEYLELYKETVKCGD